MITGFNTDVSCNGTTYHVQTEDKGDANPIILSLVYVRGAILAAKRTSYAKDLQNGLTEEQLQTMLEKQHRTILAVIKAGRIQELVEKLNKQRVSEDDAPVAAASSSLPTVSVPSPPPIPAPPVPVQMPVPMPAPVPVEQPQPRVVNSAPTYEPPQPMPTPVPAPAPSPSQSSPGYRNSGSVEVSHKGESQPLFAEFDLDKIIFDYLQTDAHEEKLEIRLRSHSEFFAGEAILLQIEVSRGGIQPLPGVPVIVKIIGTAFKPQIYSCRTGPDGLAIISVTLPNFTAGSAAIVVQSSSEAGEAEIKQLIRRR